VVAHCDNTIGETQISEDHFRQEIGKIIGLLKRNICAGRKTSSATFSPSAAFCFLVSEKRIRETE
jgi:hypothetical protein